jgi:hypothetical protein
MLHATLAVLTPILLLVGVFMSYVGYLLSGSGGRKNDEDVRF